MIERDIYNAIPASGLPKFVKDLLIDAENAGAWTTGIESDKRLRGDAINVAVYGYNETTGLVVVQVRQCVFHPRRFNRVRKDYYLCGSNEIGTFFAHPVKSPCRSVRINTETPEETVRRVLCAIWGVTDAYLDDVVRQGDVAFIPVVRIPKSARRIEGTEVLIRDTHKVIAPEIYSDGTDYYVKRGAKMLHTKQQHAQVKAREGLYKVVAGERVCNWGFTAPVGD
jgi:hypothetical protein